MRHGIISAGLLIVLLSFQNCGGMTSSSSGGDDGQTANGPLPNSKPAKIQFSLNPYSAQSFDLSFNADGTIRDAANQVLSAYANLDQDIKRLFAEASICEFKLPPNAIVCLAYTFPIAAATTTGGDLFMIVHNPTCLQDRFDFCGNVGQELADLIEYIRQH